MGFTPCLSTNYFEDMKDCLLQVFGNFFKYKLNKIYFSLVTEYHSDTPVCFISNGFSDLVCMCVLVCAIILGVRLNILSSKSLHLILPFYRYIASYIPGGQRGVKFFATLFTAFISRGVSRALPI